jgi:hypothetical protein
MQRRGDLQTIRSDHCLAKSVLANRIADSTTPYQGHDQPSTCGPPSVQLADGSAQLRRERNPRYRAHDGSTTPASRSPAARPGPIFEPVSAQPPSWTDHRAPGERAAALAACWCTRRLGRSYAQPAWQMLADAARLGVIRHGRPEAWAAGAVIALARASGLLGAGRALTAQQGSRRT